MMSNSESIVYAAPEGFLSVLILAVLLIRFITETPGRNQLFVYVLAIAGLCITLVLQLLTFPGMYDTGKELFYGMLRLDTLAHLFKILCLFCAILFLAYSATSRETSKRFPDSMEYVLLALSTTLGMILLVGASNVLMFYLAFEFLSFTSYLLTGFVDRDEKTTEAAVKYLLYGGAASGAMIYGFSLLYGLTGSLDFSVMGKYLAENDVQGFMLFISLVFILAGLGFKVALFPFHFWCPDVYEGAPTAFTAFMSVGPKAAGFAALVRVFFQVFAVNYGEEFIFPFTKGNLTTMIAVISAVTMTIGNLAALQQQNLKRLLAYSSVAHSGYIMMAVASQNQFGLTAVFFYLSVYCIMNLGAFLIVLIVSNDYYTERLEGYEGLGWKGPQGAFLAVTFTIFLFSLTGIPPFAGFIGKVYLLLAVLKKGTLLYWLAVVAVVNTVISLYYYARIVRMMFLSRGGKSTVLSVPGKSQYVQYSILGGLAFLTVLFGIYWAPLDRLSRQIIFFIH